MVQTNGALALGLASNEKAVESHQLNLDSQQQSIGQGADNPSLVS